MAAKEDILEQIVEEFLLHKGYFVQHNIKFLPRKEHLDYVKNQDSNHSDIDVLGYNPKLTGADRVWAVSCKSWQAGFKIAAKITEIEENKIISGREAWKGFRELVVPKWSEAFVDAIYEATGQREFTYVNAVTEVKGNRKDWEEYHRFKENMNNNPIKIITLKEMLKEIEDKISSTLAGTEVGRMIQLFRSAGVIKI